MNQDDYLAVNVTWIYVLRVTPISELQVRKRKGMYRYIALRNLLQLIEWAIAPKW